MKSDMYCYLYNRDKTSLTDKFDTWLDPLSTAVVCIDMHLGHTGSEHDTPVPSQMARDRIPDHNKFHRAARELGIPIIMVQNTQRANGIDCVNSKSAPGGGTWRYTFELMMPGTSDYADQLSREGTKWLDWSIESKPSDYWVRTKKRLNAFYPTDLDFILRQLNVKNVVFTGCATEVCILSACTWAAELDYRVFVPRDVVGGITEEGANHALYCISMAFGLVTDSAAFVEEWQARDARGNSAVEFKSLSAVA
jgi:nicotinamidase-related amidase